MLFIVQHSLLLLMLFNNVHTAQTSTNASAFSDTHTESEVDHSTLSLVKTRSDRVSAWELLRLSEKQMPTVEKRRSTDAEVAGQPRYCRAMTLKFGNFLAFFSHHSSPSQSEVHSS